MRLSNPKAEAWNLAARYIEASGNGSDFDCPDDVREHMLRVVVPSLRRQAQRIERNSKQGVRGRR